MGRLALLWIASILLYGASAAAQTTNDKVAAEALFREGRELAAAGKYPQACKKFEASLRVDRGVGTMLNLADCYEKNGQTASAWAQFQEASAAARSAGSEDREQHARQRAAALESVLSRLTIEVPSSPPAELVVLRDGEPVDPALFGSAVPTDPGEHAIEARAPGHNPWSQTISVPAQAGSVTVTVPELEPSGAAPSTTVDSQAAATLADQGASGSNAQRTAGLAVSGAGIVGVAVGAIFGLKASSTWNDVQARCPALSGCDDETVSLSEDANRQASVSNIAFIFGGVALTAGAVLWLTAPSSPPAEDSASAGLHVSVGAAPGAVMVRGSF